MRCGSLVLSIRRRHRRRHSQSNSSPQHRVLRRFIRHVSHSKGSVMQNESWCSVSWCGLHLLLNSVYDPVTSVVFTVRLYSQVPSKSPLFLPIINGSSAFLPRCCPHMVFKGKDQMCRWQKKTVSLTANVNKALGFIRRLRKRFSFSNASLLLIMLTSSVVSKGLFTQSASKISVVWQHNRIVSSYFISYSENLFTHKQNMHSFPEQQKGTSFLV